jgi:hypothetical protein
VDVIRDLGTLDKNHAHQVIPSQPTAKKLLNTNKKTAANIPVLVLVCEIAPASTNIEACQLSAYQLDTVIGYHGVCSQLVL